MIYFAAGYLVDMHNPDDVDFHFKMTERHGHVARLKGGIIGVSSLCIWITDFRISLAIL